MCPAGLYLMVVMILTSISVAMAVFILHISQLGERCAHVPKWLHRLITRYIARLVGMNYVVRHRMQQTQAHLPHVEEEGKPLNVECEEIATRYKLLQVEGRGLYILAKDDENVPLDKVDKEDMNDLQRIGTRENGKTLKAMKAIIVKGASSEESVCEDGGEEGRGGHRDRVPPVALMWHDIAQVIDRLLFWFCFITLTISTVSLLVILPLSKPHPADARATLQKESSSYDY